MELGSLRILIKVHTKGALLGVSADPLKHIHEYLCSFPFFQELFVTLFDHSTSPAPNIFG